MQPQSNRQSQAIAARGRPWYAHRWPWFLMLGPFLVILAGSYTSWLAFSRPDALVVGDYYNQGKAINQDLRRDVVAADLGLALTLHYDAAGGQMIGALSSHGNPYRGPVVLSLIHSTLPDKDIKLKATADANGLFKLSLPLLETARWQILLESERRDWRLAGTWNWPQQKSVALQAD